MRFSQAASPAEIAAVASAQWTGTRVMLMFLQHPSDPVVWSSPDLLFERPDWLHNYGNSQLDGWVAVAAPGGWTAADTARIRRWLDKLIAAHGPEFH